MASKVLVHGSVSPYLPCPAEVGTYCELERVQAELAHLSVHRQDLRGGSRNYGIRIYSRSCIDCRGGGERDTKRAHVSHMFVYNTGIPFRVL